MINGGGGGGPPERKRETPYVAATPDALERTGLAGRGIKQADLHGIIAKLLPHPQHALEVEYVVSERVRIRTPGEARPLSDLPQVSSWPSARADLRPAGRYAGETAGGPWQAAIPARIGVDHLPHSEARTPA